MVFIDSLPQFQSSHMTAQKMCTSKHSLAVCIYTTKAEILVSFLMEVKFDSHEAVTILTEMCERFAILKSFFFFGGERGCR